MRASVTESSFCRSTSCATSTRLGLSKIFLLKFAISRAEYQQVVHSFKLRNGAVTILKVPESRVRRGRGAGCLRRHRLQGATPGLVAECVFRLIDTSSGALQSLGRTRDNWYRPVLFDATLCPCAAQLDRMY